MVMAGILLCAVLFFVWRQRQTQQIKLILASVQEDRNRVFSESLTLYSQPLRSYVNTNSYWDELVQFTKTKNLKWASESLDISNQDHIDSIFVINNSNIKIYEFNKSKKLDKNIIWRQLIPDSLNSAYFIYSDNEVWEIQSEPITLGNDPKHHGKIFGHLIVGRRWDHTRMMALEKLTGARLSLSIDSLQSSIRPTPAPGQIRSSVQLNHSHANAPGIQLEADFDITLAQELEQFSDQTMTLFVIYGLVLILAIALSLLRWVNAPLRLLTDSLQNKKAPPTNLPGREFGELGRLVTDFLANKEALRETNEALECRVAERTATLQQTVTSLQETQQRFQEVIDHTPVTLFVMDRQGTLILLEGQGVRTANLPREKLVARSAYRLWSRNQFVQQRLRNVLDYGRDEAFTVEVRRIPFDVRIRPLRNPQGEVTGAIGIALDVTERQRFEAALKHQALYDALTGLPNRTHFREELERALSEAKTDHSLTAILFLDLDNFKLINDTLGHEIGDGLLRALATRLQETIGPRGLVARLAGDEFVILLEKAQSREMVEAVGSQLSAALSAPLSLVGRELYANASIGIALTQDGKTTPTEMLRHADVAMYRAKQSGRGRWFTFDESMSHNLQERLELESDLRTAASRDELKVFYQPIVRLSDGEIDEVEALLRWQHPRLGLIAPARFIQIAEESGAIIGLDYWALRQACTEVRAHNVAHPHRPLTLSVNLSASQFQQSALPAVVRRILDATALEPQRLKLEITEGTMMQDPHTAAILLTELKNLGVRIAIDDFGTGFSSMTYLGALPLDTLKIDRSFIRQMHERTSSLAIVHAIRQLAAALDMDVTCEGIETEEQARLLRRMGCERGQGYLYGRPAPFAELAARLDLVESLPRAA
jgi:diguanylate cyclase (GGDEF)-like protein/PAS domain S-box-containing protein